MTKFYLLFIFFMLLMLGWVFTLKQETKGYQRDYISISQLFNQTTTEMAFLEHRVNRAMRERDSLEFLLIKTYQTQQPCNGVLSTP